MTYVKTTFGDWKPLNGSTGGSCVENVYKCEASCCWNTHMCTELTFPSAQ